MKAITLTQPWATAVALGSKRIETRSWKTNHRGAIAIHAAKGYSVDDLLHKSSSWTWCGALRDAGLTMGGGSNLIDLLPFGAIVAVANLGDCRPTDSFTQGELDQPRSPGGDRHDLYNWTERMMGDYALGRFGFRLDDVRRLERPISCRGSLGLWNLPTLAERELMEQLG